MRSLQSFIRHPVRHTVCIVGPIVSDFLNKENRLTWTGGSGHHRVGWEPSIDLHINVCMRSHCRLAVITTWQCSHLAGGLCLVVHSERSPTIHLSTFVASCPPHVVCSHLRSPNTGNVFTLRVSPAHNAISVIGRRCFNRWENSG